MQERRVNRVRDSRARHHQTQFLARFVFERFEEVLLGHDASSFFRRPHHRERVEFLPGRQVTQFFVAAFRRHGIGMAVHDLADLLTGFFAPSRSWIVHFPMSRLSSVVDEHIRLPAILDRRQHLERRRDRDFLGRPIARRAS